MTKPGTDWHPEDIKAAVRKKGTTLAALSRRNGLPEHACRHALYSPFYHAEVAIAEFLGTTPKAIWPSRFRADGSRVRQPRFVKQKPIRPAEGGHGQKQEAA